MLQLTLILLAVVTVLVVGSIVVAMVAALFFTLLTACAVAVPAYWFGKRWITSRESPVARPGRIDGLQDMYIEGKIDLPEFEQRVARLVAIER